MSNVSSTLDQQPVVYIGPDGGTTGQVLAKKSNTDRDMGWVNPGISVPTSSAQGDILIRDASGWTRLAAGTSGQLLKTQGTGANPTWSTVSTSAFPSGTVMLFAQTAAPTGWTKQTTHNDKALRVVSGTAGSGGSVAFTTAFASQGVSGTVGVSGSVGATTLTVAQMPSHNHSTPQNRGGGDSEMNSMAYAFSNRTYASVVDSTGGGGSHTHSFSGSGSFSGTAINLAVQYVDVILATKD